MRKKRHELLVREKGKQTKIHTKKAKRETPDEKVNKQKTVVGRYKALIGEFRESTNEEKSKKV